MPGNTSTFGQMDSGAPLVVTDIFAIQRIDGKNYKITGTDLAVFIGSTPLNGIKLNKVAIPDDPPLEEGEIYLGAIDGGNNGLFVRLKKAGVITEVALA